MSGHLAEKMKPRTKRSVRELIEEAGVDVTGWGVRQDGSPVGNPNENTSKNSKWSFGGSGQPIVLCIWWEEIDWESDAPCLTGNTKIHQDELNALSVSAIGQGVKTRIGGKVKRVGEYQSALQEALRKRLPVRVILLAGKRTTSAEDAAKSSARVGFRELDPEVWYVHLADPYTGEYRLVRGLSAPAELVLDPFGSIEDPALSPSFQVFVQELAETEREAMIKARVGQGPFRDALIERWRGCSVTGCAAYDLLIASHIKPWSKCTTPFERLSAANGLLLTPNLDKAFDRGLITFDDRFRVLISPKLRPGDALLLHVDRNLRLTSSAHQDMLPFLEYHRQHVFQSA